MYNVWDAIDTERTVMTTGEYAKYLSNLTGRHYSTDDITYMCRNKKLPSNAKAHKEEYSNLWTIVVENTQVPKAQYIELANKYNKLLAVVQAAGSILEDFLKTTEVS